VVLEDNEKVRKTIFPKFMVSRMSFESIIAVKEILTYLKANSLNLNPHISLFIMKAYQG